VEEKLEGGGLESGYGWWIVLEIRRGEVMGWKRD